MNFTHWEVEPMRDTEPHRVKRAPQFIQNGRLFNSTLFSYVVSCTPLNIGRRSQQRWSDPKLHFGKSGL